MKLSSLLLRISLIAMIILSIILSFLIWTNNSRYQGQATTSNQTSTETQALEDKQLADVFVPTKVIGNPVGQKYLLFSRKENLVTAFRTLINKWEVTNIKKVKPTNTESYMDLINQKGTVQLLYPNPVTMKIFGKSFGQSIPKRQQEFKVDRLLITINNETPHLYLMCDDTMTVYETKLNKATISSIRKIIGRKMEQQIPLAEQLFNSKPMIFYQNNVMLTPFDYIISKQSASYYLSTLLSTADSANVDVKEQSDDVTIYQNGASENMSVYHKTGLIDYTNYLKSSTKNEDMTDYLTESFKDLTSLGNSVSGVRFFNYDADNQSVVYRNYVDDYPIFYQIAQKDNNASLGAAMIQNSATYRKIDFSVYSLQVPLPLDQDKVSLPGTQSVIDALLKAGAKQAKINRVQLGYRWNTDPDSEMVIELMPSYYVEYDGSWSEYNDLVTSLTEQGGGA